MSRFDRRLNMFRDEDEMADFLYERRREAEIERELKQPIPADELEAERVTQRIPVRVAAFQTPKPKDVEPDTSQGKLF